MQAKICGVKDKKTLKYIVSHSCAPKFIGFICNYKKSKRFLQFNKLQNLLTINKRKSKYVAVLVRPNKNELKKFSLLPFDYFQIYDIGANELRLIKKEYKIKVIAAITINDKKDVLKYNEYKNIADIVLFDSKGYEKSMSFDHKLIKNLRTKKKIMLGGNIQVDDELESYKKITDIIDISGGLETSGLKDVSKINIFLKKIKLINNEN